MGYPTVWYENSVNFACVINFPKISKKIYIFYLAKIEEVCYNQNRREGDRVDGQEEHTHRSKETLPRLLRKGVRVIGESCG